MVLGATPKAKIGKWEAQLYQGDAVVFYTDGITEARSPDGEFSASNASETSARSAPGFRPRR